MGIELALYRARIGIYGPNHRACRPNNGQSTQYSPYCSWPDVHYRMFACGLLAIFLCLSIGTWTYISQYVTSNIEPISLVGEDICLDLDAESSASFCKISITSSCFPGTNVNQEGYVYIGFLDRLLMLAADIELNPGPTSLDDILSAVKSSEGNLMKEISSVKSELSVLKDDMKSLKSCQKNLETNVQQVQVKQADIEQKLVVIDENLEGIWSWKEIVDADIQALAEKNDETGDLLDNIDEKIEQLNMKTIEDQMRIFGLSVGNNLTDSELVGEVVDKVLKVANPEVNWSSDDITRVRVIRNQGQGQGLGQGQGRGQEQG